MTANETIFGTFVSNNTYFDLIAMLLIIVLGLAIPVVMICVLISRTRFERFGFRDTSHSFPSQRPTFEEGDTGHPPGSPERSHHPIEPPVPAGQAVTSPLQLPAFWEFNPRGYFHSIELLFDSHNITDELARYSLLLQTLGKSTKVLQRISDILTSVDSSTPYSVLKSALIRRYTSQLSGNLQSILHESRRGDKTISEYLVHLRSRLGEHYDTNSLLHSDLLKHKLLESIDPQARLCLYHYEDEPLETLARHADEILSRSNSVVGSPALHHKPISNQHLINESVDSKINQLQQTIANLSNSPDGGHSGNQIARPIRSLNPQKGSPRYGNPTPQRSVSSSPQTHAPCYYHTRFGDRAIKCEGPACPSHHLLRSPQQAKNEMPVSMA